MVLILLSFQMTSQRQIGLILTLDLVQQSRCTLQEVAREWVRTKMWLIFYSWTHLTIDQLLFWRLTKKFLIHCSQREQCLYNFLSLITRADWGLSAAQFLTLDGSSHHSKYAARKYFFGKKVSCCCSWRKRGKN